MTSNPGQYKDPFFNFEFQSERVFLKPYDEERDLSDAYALLTDSRVTKFFGIDVPTFTLDKIRYSKRERMESPDSSDWSIFLNDNHNRFIGEIGIAKWDFETHIVEIFAAIGSDFFGKGIGREAVSILVEQIFAKSMISVVRVQTLATNIPALKMCSRLGFMESGQRYVPPDPEIGFSGGMAIILDCWYHMFKPFQGF